MVRIKFIIKHKGRRNKTCILIFNINLWLCSIVTQGEIKIKYTFMTGFLDSLRILLRQNPKHVRLLFKINLKVNLPLP